METWILGMARTSSLRRVFAWAAATACVVLLAISAHRYITNFILGPFNIDSQALASITDIAKAPRYFVRVTGSKAVPTGLQQITIHKRYGVETSREVSAVYYGLLVGDKFLIVKSTSGTATTAEGELSPIRPDLDRQLFGTPKTAAARGRVYPFYLDDASFRIPGYVAIAAVLVFAFFLIRRGIPAWRHLQDPSSHPAAKRVASWGDPNLLAEEVEHEARSPQSKLGGWLFTDHYLIQKTFFSFDVLRLSDVLWAFRRVTKHYMNFIPTGKTYAAVFHCYGGSAEVKGRENEVNAVLTFAAKQAPWAVYGYSKEAQQLFNKGGQDFSALVEKRRRELQQQARPGEPGQPA